MSMMKEETIQLGDQKKNYLTHGSGPHPVLLLPGALGTAKSDFSPTIRGHQFTGISSSAIECNYV